MKTLHEFSIFHEYIYIEAVQVMFLLRKGEFRFFPVNFMGIWNPLQDYAPVC